jgi:hypothetical protein
MRSSIAVAVTALLAAGCSGTPEAQLPAAQADARPAAAAPAAPAPNAAAAPLSGTVLETMDSGGYTYLRLQTSGGEQWAAVRQAPIAKGAEVTVSDAMLMEGFESPTLKRRFDRIYFGSLGGPSADAHGAAPVAMPAGHGAPHGEPAAKEPVKVVKVDRAAGEDGRTVAEVHAQRKALDGRTVAVRGTVVKFLPGIMGKNWVHLRDGSGAAATSDDDLTVTTDETVEVGKVAVMRGVVKADKDFGSGYAYRVIVEEGKVVQ